jgi:uncharacterized protein (DUF2147 family)
MPVEWARDDGVLRTHIAACGSDICAVNSWTKNPQSAGKVGDKLIMTLRETDRNHWTGSAFDHRRNLTYSVELSVAGDRMATRGCSRHSMWQRRVDPGETLARLVGTGTQRLAPCLRT